MKIFKKYAILVSFLLFFVNTVFAEELITGELFQEQVGEIVGVESAPDDLLTEEPIVYNENIFIRANGEVLFDSVINLPEDGVISIQDSNQNNHNINSKSVLSLIYSISKQPNAPFSISNLEYYSSFDALYLKCITTKDGVEFCDNWQYLINGTAPWTSIDQTILSENNSIVLYFGNPHKLVLDKNEVLEGEKIIVSASKYNYTDNSWEVLGGVNISVTKPNDLDQWNPIVVLEKPVDENGSVEISLAEDGIYNFGIKEDFSYPSYQVIVKKPSNSGGGSSLVNFSQEKAISFLSLNMGNLESFYLDWLAIGIAQTELANSSFKNQLITYLKNNDLNSSIITDNERRAMSLMSLGVNPYNGTSIDYINKIISSFDGNQIGDTHIYNDDIFSLIVLSHCGYTKNDEMIKKIVSYVISKQSSDGSWGGVDMTSASIQALDNFKSLEGAQDSISKGEAYLLKEQKTDGSFGNVFSTSWAIQALSLSNSFDLEINKAINYLSNQQNEDGGLITDGGVTNRVWATSYAIPAVLKLSWNDILENFEKENNQDDSQDEIVADLPKNIDKEEILIKEEPVLLVENIKQEIKKKENILKIKTEDNLQNNPLLGSAVLSRNEFEKETFLSMISNALTKLKFPFIWFWNYLGLLL
jgi:prenyltransferase beta subunit